MSKKQVLLLCKACDNTEIRDEYNLYTGHLYHDSWHHICDVCKGNMVRLLEAQTITIEHEEDK